MRGCLNCRHTSQYYPDEDTPAQGPHTTHPDEGVVCGGECVGGRTYLFTSNRGDEENAAIVTFLYLQ